MLSHAQRGKQRGRDKLPRKVSAAQESSSSHVVESRRVRRLCRNGNRSLIIIIFAANRTFLLQRNWTLSPSPSSPFSRESFVVNQKRRGRNAQGSVLRSESRSRSGIRSRISTRNNARSKAAGRGGGSAGNLVERKRKRRTHVRSGRASRCQDVLPPLWSRASFSRQTTGGPCTVSHAGEGISVEKTLRLRSQCMR